MSIQFLCPHCNKQFRTPDSYAGKLTRCKQCGEKMRIPEASSDASTPDDASSDDTVSSEPAAEETADSVPEVDPEESSADETPGFVPVVKGPSGARAGAKTGAMPLFQASAAPDDETISVSLPIQFGAPSAAKPAPTPSKPAATLAKPADAPAKPGANPAQPAPRFFNVNKVTISLSIFCLLLLGLGAWTGLQLTDASSTPAKMKVSQLLSGGIRGNRHIQVQGAQLWTGGKTTDGPEGSWTRVWFPIVDPKDRNLSSTSDKPKVLMVMHTVYVQNSQEIATWAKRHAFQGMVSEGSELSNADRSRINTNYPELRNAKVYVLDENEQPPSLIVIAIYVLSGLLFGGVAFVLMFLAPPQPWM